MKTKYPPYKGMKAITATLVTAVSLGLLASASPLYAVAYTWTGTGANGNWTDTGNWGGSTITNSSTIAFSGTNGLTNSNNSSITAATIQFNSSSGTLGNFTLNGNTLTPVLITSESGLQTINLNLLLSSNRSFTANSGTLVINGTIGKSGAGTRGLNAIGAGTIVLNGSNSFDGFMRVANGTTLVIGNDHALGTAPLELINNDSFIEAGGGDRSIANNVTFSNTATFRGSNSLAVSGSTTITSTANGRVLFNNISAGKSLTFSGPVAFSSATPMSFNFGGTGSTIISGAVSSATNVALNVNGGSVTLGGINSYTGTTRINAGTLLITGTSGAGSSGVQINAGTLHVDANGGADAITNSITFISANGSYVLERANGTAYSAYTSSSVLTGGRDTTASLLAGTASTARTLTTGFDSAASQSPTNDGIRASDVFSLNGTGSDLFVLQLEIADLNATQYLGWLDGTDTWVNAVSGNTGNNASAPQQGYLGSFTNFQITYGSDLSSYVGAYGVDDSGDRVWAVLNHNSEFAIIPEPSTWLLIGTGLGVLLLRRRSRC
ncbi:MAG TPA: PEP-CTERM sorting domain-containing protein [Terrimicrobiaceae bacterium]|nr:PEP-CTERM sorting domain-containing protein [Terrimicrobiaceae bacterium]